MYNPKIFIHVLGVLVAVSLLTFIIIKAMNTRYCVWNFSKIIIDSDPLSRSFNAYLKKHNKTYTDSEYMRRLQCFKDSLQEINRMNKESGGQARYGLTKFSDMSKEEFAQKMLMKADNIGEGCEYISKQCENHIHKKPLAINYTLPLECDWRKEHVIGPVLNQKKCFGCWAFSVVGVMESMIAVHGMGYTRLSIQELLDCSTYNEGCRGGNPATAASFLCTNDHAITTEKEYRLTLRNQSCKADLKKGRRLTWMKVECDMNATEIARLVAHHGPVVAAVNAMPWQNYLGGIIQRHCIGEWSYLGHVVQIVGYNSTGDVPYFIARNSWGADFGDNGYVKILMGDFICGIGRQITYFDVDNSTSSE